jgi:hypothetical protein
MVLGRLTHYAFDALAISTVLAGVKKQTGFGYVPSLSVLLLPFSCVSRFSPLSLALPTLLEVGSQSTEVHM